MIGFIRDLYTYRSMIYNLVKRDLRGRYKGSILGFLWNFVLPLMQILVYIAVFTIVFKQNIEDYYVYLIVGMIPWTMFSDSISGGAGSVVDNSQLVTKIYFPRTVIPVSIVISKFVNFLISMVFVIAVIFIGGHGFDAAAAATVPIAVLFLFMFSLGLAVLLAAANVYLRDVQYLITVILMMWIWLTPIMYVQDFIDNDAFRLLLDFNPMTYIIGLFQDALYWEAVPSMERFLICFAESAVMMVAGFWIYQKVSPDFAEVMRCCPATPSRSITSPRSTGPTVRCPSRTASCTTERKRT